MNLTLYPTTPPNAMPEPTPEEKLLNASRLREAALWDQMVSAFAGIISERAIRGRNAECLKIAPYREHAIHNAQALRDYVSRGGK